MTFEPLNRRLAIAAAVFAFVGVILGAFALATDYWTIGKIDDLTVKNESLPVEERVHTTVWNVRIHQFLLGSDEHTCVLPCLLLRVYSKPAPVGMNNASDNFGPVHS